jgi:hypothetical protein
LRIEHPTFLLGARNLAIGPGIGDRESPENPGSSRPVIEKEIEKSAGKFNRTYVRTDVGGIFDLVEWIAIKFWTQPRSTDHTLIQIGSEIRTQ